MRTQISHRGWDGCVTTLCYPLHAVAQGTGQVQALTCPACGGTLSMGACAACQVLCWG